MAEVGGDAVGNIHHGVYAEALAKGYPLLNPRYRHIVTADQSFFRAISCRAPLLAPVRGRLSSLQYQLQAGGGIAQRARDAHQISRTRGGPKASGSVRASA